MPDTRGAVPATRKGRPATAGAQDPKTPKLVGRIKTSASGTAFRLTTDVTVQDVFEAVPGRLRLNGAVRFSAASYEVDEADVSSGGQPLWPARPAQTSRNHTAPRIEV